MNCALECGAKIDFVDIDKKSWNISISQLEKVKRVQKSKNKLPKLLVLVHLAGTPNKLDKVHQLSKNISLR